MLGERELDEAESLLERDLLPGLPRRRCRDDALRRRDLRNNRGLPWKPQKPHTRVAHNKNDQLLHSNYVVKKFETLSSKQRSENPFTRCNAMAVGGLWKTEWSNRLATKRSRSDSLWILYKPLEMRR